MKKNKTLIILTPGFPENEEDSTCLPPRQIFVRSLRENYPDLNIIVLAFQYPFLSGEYNWNGVKVISFNGRSKGKTHRLIVWVKVWRVLKEIKSENNITGILSFWLGECSLIGKYFAKKYRLKHYCWILGQDAKRGNRYFRLINPDASSLIALSDFIAEEFFKNYAVLPGHVIPVGIDPSSFGQFPDERDIDILGAGSLIPLKQYDLFVSVVKFLSHSFPDIHTVICGEGKEKEKLIKLIKDQGLENNISLTGEIPHKTVLSLMQRTKIFLHPSLYEGFGSVLLEALYAGAHVVSFVNPMSQPVRNHYAVRNITEMNDKVFDLLKNSHLQHEPALPYPIKQVTKEMMKLFD